jgi:hypothetical protein
VHRFVLGAVGDQRRAVVAVAHDEVGVLFLFCFFVVVAFGGWVGA